MKRDATLNFRLPAALKDALSRAAEGDHGRSLSGMAVRVIEEWLQEKGYLNARKPPVLRRKKG